MSAVDAPAAVRARLEPLLAVLRRAYGERLRSVVVHGPSLEARTASVPLSVLVLIDGLDAGSLLPLAPELSRCQRAGIAPAYLATEQLARSLDVFPLELLDMRANYTVVHGEDPLAALEFERGPLRLQLEEELRGLLSHLRQCAALEGHRPKRMRLAVAQTITALGPVLRAMLLLERRDVPADLSAMWQVATDAFGLDRARLERLAAVGPQVVPPELWDRVAECDALLCELLSRVDQWDAS